MAAAKYALSILRRRSRTRPSPTVDSAAGLESLANSLLTMVSPANFLGVTNTSAMVGSDAVISAPSAVHTAVGSADTTGILKSWLPVSTHGVFLIGGDLAEEIRPVRTRVRRNRPICTVGRMRNDSVPSILLSRGSRPLYEAGRTIQYPRPAVGRTQRRPPGHGATSRSARTRRGLILCSHGGLLAGTPLLLLPGGESADMTVGTVDVLRFSCCTAFENCGLDTHLARCSRALGSGN